MALTQYTADTDIIETLGTNPEDRPTLTDNTFKAKFDENSANIKTFLNAMIAELASTAAGKGASQIGIEDSGSKFTAATVEAALAEVATLISTKINPSTIRNGCFRVNQRAVSGTVSLASGAHGHDGWKAGSGGCTYTFATSGGVTTLTISAGSLVQVIEGKDLETATYVMSWTGTAQGKIGAGSYSTTGTNSPVTGGSDLSIEFGTGTLSKVKLEKGTTATPFAMRPYETELAVCQRYCLVIENYLYVRMSSYLTNTVDFFVQTPTTMRSVPSISGAGFAVETIVAGVQTGFTISVPVKLANGLLVRGTKTSHGLTDAMLATTGATILSADL